MRRPLSAVVDDGEQQQHVVDEHRAAGEPVGDVVERQLADADVVGQHQVDHDGHDDDARR